MKRALFFFGLSLLAACGSPVSPGADAGVDAGVPMPSMFTAAGSLTGTITAPKPTVGYDAAGDEGSFLLKKSVAGLPFKADVTIEFTGAPAAMTYTSTSPGFSCNVLVTSGTAAADTWVALYNSPAGANKGSCSLTFTSATTSASGYTVAGTLSITADNSGGAATGMVTLTGSF